MRSLWSGFNTEGKRLCQECGTELEEGAPVCYNCGCPIEVNDSNRTVDELKQVEQSESRESHKKRKWIIVGAIVVVSILIALGISIYQKKIRSQEYSENFQLAVYTMLAGAADAENCCNLIVQVWNNAIWEKEDNSTDQYTKPNGVFVEDFNEALDNLFTDLDFLLQLNKITDNQETVNLLIGTLKNPPKEYTKAYETLAECYDAYLTFTNMAVNPTGSLNTFSADFHNADDEFIHYYQLLEFYLQE